MSPIQLWYGIVCDNQKKIKINLPSKHKTEVLFSKLPYLTQLHNPTFKEKIENILNNNKAVQKYFLTTGDLQNSIQENLNYIVLDDEKLNKASAVRHLLNTKLPKNVLQKPYVQIC